MKAFCQKVQQTSGSLNTRVELARRKIIVNRGKGKVNRMERNIEGHFLIYFLISFGINRGLHAQLFLLE